MGPWTGPGKNARARLASFTPAAAGLQATGVSAQSLPSVSPDWPGQAASYFVESEGSRASERSLAPSCGCRKPPCTTPSTCDQQHHPGPRPLLLQSPFLFSSQHHRFPVLLLSDVCLQSWLSPTFRLVTLGRDWICPSRSQQSRRSKLFLPFPRSSTLYHAPWPPTTGLIPLETKQPARSGSVCKGQRESFECDFIWRDWCFFSFSFCW